MSPPSPPSAPPQTAERRPGQALVVRHSSRILATLLVRRGKQAGQRLAVLKPLATIGQGRQNDLQLLDQGVGNSHARLELRQGIWFLLRIGATNAVRVDGELVRGEIPLSPGSTLLIGPVALLFEPRDQFLHGNGAWAGRGRLPRARGLLRPGLKILLMLIAALLALALEGALPR